MVEYGRTTERSMSPAAGESKSALIDTIAQLARDASVEINFQDIKHLEASRALLAPGKKIYVSHLPKQTWQQSDDACVAVRASGFEPVPHVPVRLLPDSATLHRFLTGLVRNAQVKEVLLIAGDYDAATGPYSSVTDVLRGAALEGTGLTRVSLAGHPEGHPKVALAEIRAAEREKTRLATSAGLEASLLTQFFFEPRPFLDWVSELRANGVGTRIVAGLAGPARLSTLFKFALRCGAGASIRALGTHPGSLMKLIGDHGPESLLQELAQARASGESDFSGIHLFCFGGYLRTCEWLHGVASGHFELTASGFSQA
jgi:methylenetetrahydrofolate reductase (NADPH)